MSPDRWQTADKSVSPVAMHAVHLPFVQRLADTAHEGREWSEAAVGLLVLRAVDHWLQPVAPNHELSAASLRDLDARIARIATESDFAPFLRKIVACTRRASRGASPQAVEALAAAIRDYGVALNDSANWTLALDAYQTAGRVGMLLADPPRTRLEAYLVLWMGIAHSHMGSLRDAAEMYARAGELARRVRWREGELRADRGEAKLLMMRGALPEAQRRLEQNASQAAADGLAAVQARALHDLGVVLGMRGQLGEAIKRLFDAYRLTPVESAADRWDVLSDIAYAFSLVGLQETARDVFRVIARRGSRRRVRWVAATSLIELAVVAGDVPEFEYWRDWVGGQRLSPELRAQYFLDVGRGKLAFGQLREAVQSLELALGTAEEFGYGQFIFMAEAALATARERLLQSAARPSVGEPDRDAKAIAEIGDLLLAELAIV